MPILSSLSNIVRSQGDPKVVESGQGSLYASDRLARALGWFSLGLGLLELLSPRLVTRTLGLQGNETLVRAYGAREIGAGIVTLSTDKDVGLQGRVAGDVLDIVTLIGLQGKSAKKDNMTAALAVVLGVTLLDVVGAIWVRARESRSGGEKQSYAGRSGFPRGIAQARGAARDFMIPRDMRAAPQVR